METRVVTSHLPADLAEKLDGLAERLDRPKGWVVKEAIASYVALEEQRHRLTREALADVKAGRTHDHAEIETQASSLGKPKRKARRQDGVALAASARADLVRTHEFLEPVNPRAAAAAVRREVRRLLIGAYEMRYAVIAADIVVLRIFHMREDR